MRALRFIAVWLGCVLCLASDARAAALTRLANTTLKVPEVPGSFGYTVVDAFPGLTFTFPVAVATPPGETNRVFVLERGGRVAVVTNLAAPTRTVFLDISARVRTDSFNEMGLLGLAFHPQYAQNGRFFLFYTTTATTTGSVNTRHDRLSEFKVSAGNPAQADAASEKILLQQSDGLVNHNGGDLHFGPDHYLYVSLGDEGGANDSGLNSQLINRDFFSGILRLDVDDRPGSLAPNSHPAVVGNYKIPADNPYVGTDQFNGMKLTPSTVRTEFWSVGLRNPWRMAFDRVTGELWVGDVGQDRREGIVIARPGSNHGWAVREHDIAGPRVAQMQPDFMTNPLYRYAAPVWSYAHGSGEFQGNSVIGGRVYRGSRLSSLYGAYVFADYVSGNIWSLRRGAGTPQVTRLLSFGGISAFGEDPRNGDLLIAAHEKNRILRLDYSATFIGTRLPERLSDTGAFADLVKLDPQPGIVPYEINTPFWSDGALKRRWFSVPDPNKRFDFDAVDPWGLPAGAVWIKHFDLELTNGVPASTRRLETRFLVRNASGIHGFTYRWNTAQTDAELVSESGLDEAIERLVDGAPVTQVWHYPSRSECQVCHNSAAGHALGFNTAQLHRSFEGADGRTNFIAALAGAGYFANSVSNLHVLQRSASPHEPGADVEWRARSWLSANCAACHRPGGPGGGRFDARLSTPTQSAGLIEGALVSDGGDPANRVIAPGDPTHSRLLARLSTRGPGQMPPLASSLVDPAGVEVVTGWIQALANPVVPSPVELSLTLSGSEVVLQTVAPAGRALQIQVSVDPTDPAGWQPLDQPDNGYFVPDANRTIRLSTELLPGASSYFRAAVLAP